MRKAELVCVGAQLVSVATATDLLLGQAVATAARPKGQQDIIESTELESFDNLGQNQYESFDAGFGQFDDENVLYTGYKNRRETCTEQEIDEVVKRGNEFDFPGLSRALAKQMILNKETVEEAQSFMTDFTSAVNKKGLLSNPVFLKPDHGLGVVLAGKSSTCPTDLRQFERKIMNNIQKFLGVDLSAIFLKHEFHLKKVLHELHSIVVYYFGKYDLKIDDWDRDDARNCLKIKKQRRNKKGKLTDKFKTEYNDDAQAIFLLKHIHAAHTGLHDNRMWRLFRKKSFKEILNKHECNLKSINKELTSDGEFYGMIDPVFNLICMFGLGIFAVILRDVWKKPKHLMQFGFVAGPMIALIVLVMWFDAVEPLFMLIQIAMSPRRFIARMFFKHMNQQNAPAAEAIAE